MNRRHFFTGIAAGLLMARTPVSASNGRKPPLILHTIALRPEPDQLASARSRADELANLRVGDRLDLQQLSVDMGHHEIALYRGDDELSRFRSRVVGSMFDHGEPMFALITDYSAAGALRVDVILGRPLQPDERLQLLVPNTAKLGLPAYLAYPENDHYRATLEGWHPVAAARWCFCWVPDPQARGAYETHKVLVRTGPRLMPIKRRMSLWNDTPWPDLDPAVAVARQAGDDFAYIYSPIDAHVEQLLLRGQRIEARVVRPGDLGEVHVDLALVA